MEIFKIAAIGIIATIFSVMLKNQKPEFSLHISIITGLLIFLFILSKLASVLEVFNTLAQKTNIDTVYIITILKIIGIAYIAEFGAQVCRDAGENAIASKIELGGKVLIMVLGIPILIALLDLIIKLIP
mgnify:CR=1 FL=1